MYGKYYAQTFTGSMMGRGSVVFAVWGYVIANAKQDGAIELNPMHVAALLGDTVEAVEGAIAFLCDVDPRSRSEAEDGRRLMQVGRFLYRVVNHEVYQNIRNDNERRDYMRNYMREYRKGPSVDNGAVNANVNTSKPQLAHVDVDVDVDVDVPVDVDKGKSTTLVEPVGSTAAARRNGKHPVKPVDVVVERLHGVLAEVAAGTRERLKVEEVRALKAEMVFAYWALKTNHSKAGLDVKRQRVILNRLLENQGDVSELLYVVDGCLRDDHLMGREKDSTKKYDGIQTIFRDRAMVERLAESMKGYRDGTLHPVAQKYADVLQGPQGNG